MASKRVTKSALDWNKFASMVPKEELTQFNQFKGRSDFYAGRVAVLPDKLPSIDWEYYKKLAPSWTSVIDDFQKQFSNVQSKVPYPTAQAEHQEIDKEQQEDTKELNDLVQKSAKYLEECVRELDWWTTLPPADQMHPQHIQEMFPEWYIYHPCQKPDRENFRWHGPDWNPILPLDVQKMYYDQTFDFKYDYVPGYQFESH